MLGIIKAFIDLSAMGSTSLKSVGPGIAMALYATAVGLFAAIPAAIAYNYFGHTIREIGARMDDFALEFLNLAERTFGSDTEPRPSGSGRPSSLSVRKPPSARILWCLNCSSASRSRPSCPRPKAPGA